MARRIIARTPMIERFWARVDKQGPIHPVLGTRCWLWKGAPGRDGYGRIGRPGDSNGQELAHRYAYSANVGPIPEGMNVCHYCDVHLCVNYEEHLFLGTQADNLADMVQKGRHRGTLGKRLPRCRNGHEWTESTTLIVKRSSGRTAYERQCRICNHARYLSHLSASRTPSSR